MRLLIAGLLIVASCAPCWAQSRYGLSDPSESFSDLRSPFGQQPAATESPSPPADSRFGSASERQANPLRGALAPASTPVAPAPSRPATRTPAVSPLAPSYPSGRSNPGSTSPPARSSAAARSASATRSSPQQMMTDMLEPYQGSRLTGTPLSLDEVVAGAATRAEQTARIDAYWDLCSSTADYYLGLRESVELGALQRRLPRVSSVLSEADRELRVRLGTSERAAVAAQQRLAAMMGRSTLGLPGDLPHCGDYDTRINEVFPGQAPAEARQLHELLPLRLAELQDAAEAVSRSEQWVRSVERQPTQNGAGVIRALELLALNRRAFVQIARDYNRRITRYAEVSRPGRIDNGRLVAMLIGRPASVLARGPAADSTSSGVTFRPPSSSGSGLR